MSLVFPDDQLPNYDARVAFIQLLLETPSNQIDGVFGPKTAARVQAFQGATGDGRVDSTTGARLLLPYWDAKKSRSDLVEPFRDPNTASPIEFMSRLPEGGGHYCSQPESFKSGAKNKWSVRALRANNPGALNFSPWQKSMPGYVGKTKADSVGNITTIYQSPEDGVQAWHELIVVIYCKKSGFLNPDTGTFSLQNLARAYAGVGLGTSTSDPDVAGYLAGWKKWSDRIPESRLDFNAGVDPTNVDQLRRLAIAMFSHESSFATPLITKQIELGIVEAQRRLGGESGPEHGAGAAPSTAGRHMTIKALQEAPIARGKATTEEALEAEEENSQLRRKTLQSVIELQRRIDRGEGIDINEAMETGEIVK